MGTLAFLNLANAASKSSTSMDKSGTAVPEAPLRTEAHLNSHRFVRAVRLEPTVIHDQFKAQYVTVKGSRLCEV